MDVGIDAPPAGLSAGSELRANMQVSQQLDQPIATLMAEAFADLPRGLPWMGEARPACTVDYAAEVFTVAGDLHDARSAIREAKRVCASCPYRRECLDWAVSNGERWGVWGGMTPVERRAYARGMARGNARNA